MMHVFRNCITTYIVAAATLAASPFEARGPVHLGYLTEGGDLLLRFTLADVPLSSENGLELTLSHALERSSFHFAKSIFHFYPLETFIQQADNCSFEWNSPNGRVYHFGSADLVKVVEHPTGESSNDNGVLRIYEFSDIRATFAQKTEHWDFNTEGWTLRYDQGHLSGFVTPDGKLYSAGCHGSLITTISREGNELLRVTLDNMRRIIGIQAGETLCRFEYNKDGALEAYINDGRIITFEYQNGLLYKYSFLSEKTLVSWTEFPRTGMAVGFNLSRCGEKTYTFKDEGGVRTLAEVSSSGTERLVLKERYGMLLGVTEEHRTR